MGSPCKIVTFTTAERDNYRKLKKAQEEATREFDSFVNSFKTRNSPVHRGYRETVEMTILDAPDADGTGGTTHAYFEKEIE